MKNWDIQTKFETLHKLFRLKVRDLLHAVGKKAGVDPSVIDNLDLENIVERTVAINVDITHVETKAKLDFRKDVNRHQIQMKMWTFRVSRNPHRQVKSLKTETLKSSRLFPGIRSFLKFNFSFKKKSKHQVFGPKAPTNQDHFKFT